MLSAETVARLDTPLVVGPANNQLTDDAVADDLAARGILWIPDYVASAGGILYTLSREAEGWTTTPPSPASRRSSRPSKTS